MPRIYSKYDRTPVGSIFFEVTAPNWLSDPEYYSRVSAERIRSMSRAYAQRILREAQRGYDFETLRSSFQVVQPTVRKRNTEITFGIATDDAVFRFVEWDTEPHWPPPTRSINGVPQPGTGIEGWIDRLPDGGYDESGRQITPYVVQRKVAMEGTKGRQVVTKAMDRAADDFQRRLADMLTQLLTGDIL